MILFIGVPLRVAHQRRATRSMIQTAMIRERDRDVPAQSSAPVWPSR
jgi:hypothetical protein